MAGIGWMAPHVFGFWIQYHIWPWEQKLKILCECASENNTYEIPWFYRSIKTGIPITLSWHVSKPFEFVVQIKVDAPKKKLITIDKKIDTKDNNWASKKLFLPLRTVGGEYLELRSSEIGKKRPFEIIVRADTPTSLKCREKIDIFFVPWLHITQLSAASIYEGDDVICSVRIINKGVRNSFIVIYEVYRIKNGKERSYVKGRIGGW